MHAQERQQAHKEEERNPQEIRVSKERFFSGETEFDPEKLDKLDEELKATQKEREGLAARTKVESGQ